MTLEEALKIINKDNPDVTLRDGAEDWSAENLMMALQDGDDDGEILQSEVVINDDGIYFVKENGYVESVPAWKMIGQG